MEQRSGNLRALTAAEIGFAETRWIKRVRRSMWIQGGCAALCAALSLVSGGMIFTAGAVVMSLVCLKSRRDLNLIDRDLSAGLVEEIIGSMRKAETGCLAFSVAAGFAYRLFTRDFPEAPNRFTTIYYLSLLVSSGLLLWVTPTRG